MPENRQRFAESLKRHDPSRLRAAFEATNQADQHGGYDRTTLNRWLHGALPTREDFVVALGDRLEDPGLHEAWQAARRTPRGSTGPEGVIERFQQLDPDGREAAYRKIRQLYLERFPETRRRLTYRVEIHDAVDPDTDHYEIRYTVEYDGSLPENASLVFATHNRELSAAYQDPTCVFREVLDFPPDRFAALLAGWPDQVQAYNAIGDADQDLVTHTASPREGQPGIFDFGNDAVTEARIRHSLTYPYPKGVSLFKLRFGRYRVLDGAEVILTLYARSLSRPRAFAYLPAGRQQEFATSLVRPNELRLTLGAGGTTLSEGDGAILSWTETQG